MLAAGFRGGAAQRRGMRLAAIIKATDGTAAPASLVAGEVYYAELDISPALLSDTGLRAWLLSVEYVFDAAIIATITVESTNRPLTVVTAHADGWSERSPTPVPSISIAGGATGARTSDWSNLAPGRVRIKIVVGGTGGVLSIYYHLKA